MRLFITVQYRRTLKLFDSQHLFIQNKYVYIYHHVNFFTWYIINNDLAYTGIHSNFAILRYDYVMNIITC